MKPKPSSHHSDSTMAEHEAPFKDDDDICRQLMDRYSASSAPQHRHLLATAAAMRSILDSESLPRTPYSYFAAAVSALTSPSQTLDPTAVSALLTFLSIVVALVREGEIAAAKATEAVEVLVSVVEREGLSVACVKCGVKCLGVLTAGFCDLEDWDSVKLGFQTLLKFSLDKRPKVRRCAQECLEKIFKSLHCSLVTKETSKLVLSLLKKHMPEAVRLSTLKTVNRPKDETLSKLEHHEILHMLNVLKLTIPFLDTKVTSKILCELCKLMNSEFSPLTRHVLESVEAIFKRAEVIIPEVENVITPLASYLCLDNKSPVETVIAAANLLKCALDKLRTGESSAWIRNVPIVCGSVAGLLTSEASIGSQASSILKDLFEHHILIGENQSSEGQIHGREEINAVKSICTTLENILDTCDGIPNEHILAVTSVLFCKLGAISFTLMRNIVLKLAGMMTLAKKDTLNTDHLQSCIGSAVTAMGPENVLALLPISFHVDDFACSNIWLVPLLKSYVVGSSIGYYLDHIVPLAKSIERASRKVNKSMIGQDLQAHAHSLWGLLPAFCHYPIDTHKNFGPLAELLMKHLKKDSFMHETIAMALKVLVHQNRRFLGSQKDATESSAPVVQDSSLKFRKELFYSKKMATRNLKALALCSAELLQALTDLFIDSAPEKRSYLKDAIGCLASITDSSITTNMFTSLLERFQFVNGRGEFENQESPAHELIDDKQGNLGALQRDAQRCLLMELASSLVEGAKEDLIHLIYNFITHTFQATDNFGQREVYHTLSRILEEHEWFCSSQLEELIDLLLGLKATDDIALLRSRYACFPILMVHALKISLDEENTKAFLMLNEIILALKDAKEEGRKVAYDMLLTISCSLKESSSTISDGPYDKLINMIMGYLSGSSPQIRSAAVSALSVLAYKDPDICLSKPDLVSSLLSLLQSKGLEVIKAVLGFVKVLVSCLQAKDLDRLLSDIVGAVIPWSSVSRNHFRSKVTVILEILIRKCGTSAVVLVTPEKFKGFIKNVLENRHNKTGSKEVNNIDSEATVADSSTKGTHKRKHKHLDTIPEENRSAKQKKRKKDKTSSANHPSSKEPHTYTKGKRPRNSDGVNAMNDQLEGSWRKRKRSFDKSPASSGKRKIKQTNTNKKDNTAVHRPTSVSKFRKYKKSGKK